MTNVKLPCAFQGCSATAEKRLVLLIPRVASQLSALGDGAPPPVQVELGLLACATHEKMGVRDVIKEEGWSLLLKHASDRGPLESDIDKAVITAKAIPQLNPPKELMLVTTKMSMALSTFEQVRSQATKIQAAKQVIKILKESIHAFKNFPGANGKAARAEAAEKLERLVQRTNEAMVAIAMVKSEEDETMQSAKDAINAMAGASVTSGQAVHRALMASNSGN